MSSNHWLSLVEYSAKHQTSLSTLRRRIKSDHIEYRLEGGKYYILDDSELVEPRSFLNETQGVSNTAIQDSSKNLSTEVASTLADIVPKSAETISSEDEANINGIQTAAENAFLTAKELLDELKKSYSFILQEKEEQILYLKNEISDLRTLVRVLEEDNTKLRKYIEHLHNITE